MKILIWINLLLGFWLMASPFLVRLIYAGSFRVTWVDLIFGFIIAAISLARLFARRLQGLLITDWLVTIIAVLTTLNPLLYNYYGDKLAIFNNFLIGGAALLIAGYVDWRDSHRRL
ncbi:MAG TPA: SPW repeat protein [Candidatus Binatia bacterium]|jgi:hypothetical protein